VGEVVGGANRVRGICGRSNTFESHKRLARGQRKASVNAEAVVWRALRDRRCGDFKFRRQVPIGNYIADFICFEKRLIVEVDGTSHGARSQHDAVRDEWFRSEGFRVLRISNDLVIGSPDLAIQQIIYLLND
jgi:very-short-patch-repair endonuclease